MYLGKKKKLERKIKRVPYRGLDGNFTQIANTMFRYIPNGNDYKVYCYLCYRFNRDLDYSCPSFNTISRETKLSVKTVQKSIKWLEDQGFIKKLERQNCSRTNNCYYIGYILEDKEEPTKIMEGVEEINIEVVIKEINKSTNKHKRKKDYAYKKWRDNVLKRDDYTCQLCGRTDDEAILNVHHIEKYSDNEELRVDVNNGITLCYDCHKKIFSKEKEFEDYFKQLINR